MNSEIIVISFNINHTYQLNLNFSFLITHAEILGLPGGSLVKKPPVSAGDPGSVSWLGNMLHGAELSLHHNCESELRSL